MGTDDHARQGPRGCWGGTNPRARICKGKPTSAGPTALTQALPARGGGRGGHGSGSFLWAHEVWPRNLARAPRRMLSSRVRRGGGLGGRPELSVDTKGSLSTSGQAQASAGSTPCDGLLGNVFASGLSEGSRAEKQIIYQNNSNTCPLLTAPPRALKPALPRGFLCGSCARSLPARRQLLPTRQHQLHGLPGLQSAFLLTRPRAAHPRSCFHSCHRLSTHSLSPERLHGEHRTRPSVQRCPLSACTSSLPCALVPGGHTGQSRRGSNF